MSVPQRFVTTDWLAQHLDDPRVAIVDGSWYLPTMQRDAKAEYVAQHIPGAVHFDIDAIRETGTPLPHMLPDVETFERAVSSMGIAEDMTIVVYDGAGLFSAPRVRWTFQVFGAEDVRILEGGLPKWIAEGRALAQGPATATPRKFSARFDPGVIADVGLIREVLDNRSAQVVDARPSDRFGGQAPEPRPGVRAGHMPGSFNVPFTTVVSDGRLADPETIRRAFQDAGVDVDQPIVTSCGSGVTAAILSLALEVIDAPAAALYDGSWAEWGSRDDCPIAVKPTGA
jgi:thiosulfate/3-mercaptopyruvate sulfurtransferase